MAAGQISGRVCWIVLYILWLIIVLQDKNDIFVNIVFISNLCTLNWYCVETSDIVWKKFSGVDVAHLEYSE